METKKDELLEKITRYLKKWGSVADESHRAYMLIAKFKEDTTFMRRGSMQDMALMLSLATIGSPETALVIKKVAAMIDKLMLSESTYQKLKDDKDLPKHEKDRLFMHYFEKAVERKRAGVVEITQESSSIDFGDEDDNEDEQS